MTKDRAAPFSKKHRRYWIPIVIGMIVIGAINLGIGLYLYYTGPKDAPRPRQVPPPELPTPR